MKNNNILSVLMILFSVVPAIAQTEKSDTIKTQQLKEVVVESQQNVVMPSRSIYVPTVKQKRSAMSGDDLVKLMPLLQFCFLYAENIRIQGFYSL